MFHKNLIHCGNLDNFARYKAILKKEKKWIHMSDNTITPGIKWPTNGYEEKDGVK